MKRFKTIPQILFLSIFALWLFVSIFFSIQLRGLNEKWFYWLFLAFVVYLIKVLKLKTMIIFNIALFFGVAGGMVNIIGGTFSEQLIRVSLFLWLVALGQHIVENRHE